MFMPSIKWKKKTLEGQKREKDVGMGKKTHGCINHVD